MTDIDQEILKLMKRMDERLTALEGGKKPTEKPVMLSPTEIICKRVREALETKQLVILSQYGSGAALKWARDELAKDSKLRVISEGKETYIIRQTPQKTVNVVVKPGEKGQNKPKKRKWNDCQGKIDKVIAKLDKGKKLKSGQIAKICHTSQTYALNIMNQISQMKGYKQEKDGNQWVLSCSDPKPITKNGYMIGKSGHSAYTKFMGERLGYYRTQGGMDKDTAFRSAVADWNRLKTSTKPTPQSTARAFPALPCMDSNLTPILVGILEKMFVNGFAIDFKGISYALDISKENQYVTLIEEIIKNEAAIKAYFGISGGILKWDGQSLKFQA